jgi:hypothetical protein
MVPESTGPISHDQNQRSNIPIPDPSLLTIEALDREIGHLRELLGGKLDEITKDFELFKASHGDHHAAAVDAAIRHRRELTEEQLRGVQAKLDDFQRQLDDLVIRIREAFEVAEKAVSTALEASEKAGAKSEAAVSKQIEGLQAQFGTSIAAIQAQIGDIKVRLASGEGAKVAAVEGHEKFSQNWGMILGAILAVIGVISLILGVLNAGAS